MFKTKAEIKEIKFGEFVFEPKEGEMLTLIQDGNTISASPVEKFVAFYEERLWIVETRNSIYVLVKR